jgi:CheY-like chemotaxis protein
VKRTSRETISSRGSRPGIAYDEAGVVRDRQRILVIDDQPMLVKAIRRMLVGHEVITASDAGSALELIRSGERFDVILCDLMLPHITGMALHDMIAETAPDQTEKMVFMTGGAFTSDAHEFFCRVPNPLVEKPFDRAALIAVISSVPATPG